MGSMLCKISDTLCFGDAKTEKLKNQWVEEHGATSTRGLSTGSYNRNPLLGGNTRRRRKNKHKKTLRHKR